MRLAGRGVTALCCGLAAHATMAAFPSAALRNCQEVEHTAEGAGACYQALLAESMESAERAEALRGLGEFQRANSQFQVAVRTDPDDADVRTRWGRLFLAAHQVADAEALFTEALALDPDHVDALVGLAELAADGFEGRAQEAVSRALSLEPDHPGANMLLARLHLEAGESDSAREILRDVVESTEDVAVRLRAYALLAAADHMAGDLPSEWTTRALDQAAAFGDVYAVPAYYYVITRRYREAVSLLEQAVEIDADNFAAHGTLGINLLRVNRLKDARLHLELAHRGHGFDARVVNTLRLLDTLDGFETYRSQAAVLRISVDEAAVLTPYVVEAIDRARREMAERYDFVLERPVVVELYPHHDDFAVRTAGLPGIGILGAAFGDVVVMNGPSAQSADDFDWANALWHELAHVFTLNMTNNLVSRWFSEGVSVFEEWTHGPTPRASVSMGFIEAYADGRLLPIAELENGFMRPTYPDQIEVSYIQSGLVCQFIDMNFEQGLVRMLHAYRDGADTVTALRKGLGVDPDLLEERFAGFLDDRFGALAAELPAFRENVEDAGRAIKAEDWDAAIHAAGLAVDRYPEYVGVGSPYLLLARAAERAQKPEIMRRALGGFWRAGGRNMAALDDLDRLLMADGNKRQALEVRRTLVRAEPLVIGRHAELGDLLSEMGSPGEALVEYQAVLALEPFDRAAAYFKVARSLHRLHRTDEARRALLQSLEIAPRYRPALSLLIEMKE